MSEARSIEVKVGALILVSLVLLGGFVLLMGGLSFEKTYPVYVDFDNPGGLLSGCRRAHRRGEDRQREGPRVSRWEGRSEDRAPCDRPRADRHREAGRGFDPPGRGFLRDGARRARRAVSRDRPRQPGQAAARRRGRGQRASIRLVSTSSSRRPTSCSTRPSRASRTTAKRWATSSTTQRGCSRASTSS